MADSLESFMGNSGSGLPYSKEECSSPDLRKQARRRTFGRKAQLTPLKLRGLSQRHLEILALHLSGDHSNTDIAAICGISLGKINAVLDDPLAQSVIEQYRGGQLAELEGLLPKVTSTIRETLDSGDDKVRLQAVDRFIKMSKQDFGDQLPSHNLAITITDARTRFIEKVREIVDITPEKTDARTASTAPKEILAASPSDTPAE